MAGLSTCLNPKLPIDQQSAEDLFKEGIQCFYDNDTSRAVQYLEISSRKGHVEAQNRLGCAYLDGLKIPRDEAKALEWLQKAAAKGHEVAISHLANMKHPAYQSYRNGKDLLKSPNPADHARGFELIKTAADQGLPPAQLDLAHLHLLGYGTPYDLKAAKAWFKRSEAHGYPEIKIPLVRFSQDEYKTLSLLSNS